MCDYEICPTCGATLDCFEKCSQCNPRVAPIPIAVYPSSKDGVIHKSKSIIQKEGYENDNESK